MEENEDDMKSPMEGGEAPKREVPQWAVPARRSDAIGMLAWQLVGEDDGTPDFTAAVPLADALRDAGDFEAAIRLEKAIVALLPDVQSRAGRPATLRIWMNHLAEQTRQSGRHLLYDFASVTSVLVRAVELAATPVAPPVEESISATVVRVDVSWRSRGQRIALADGREGLVIEEPDSNGFARVLLDAK